MYSGHVQLHGKVVTGMHYRSDCSASRVYQSVGLGFAIFVMDFFFDVVGLTSICKSVLVPLACISV